MKVRFFGSPDCQDCLEIFVFLNKFQVEYEYINGHDESDEVQEFCDQHDVYDLPHLQFLDNYSNIVFEHIGPTTEDEFEAYLENYFPNY